MILSDSNICSKPTVFKKIHVQGSRKIFGSSSSSKIIFYWVFGEIKLCRTSFSPHIQNIKFYNMIFNICELEFINYAYLLKFCFFMLIYDYRSCKSDYA